MDPVFTLQWPEFIVSERIQKLCPRSEGYSVYIPLSRQEKGVDIAILHRNKSSKRTITVQIKASRTYMGTPPKRSSTVRYKYYTWFNRFTPSPDADYFALIGFYPHEENRTTSIRPSWYRDCTLLFSYKEIKHFMDNCKTVGGKMDPMFGFGFDTLDSIVCTRGDSTRSSKDYSHHILDKKIKELKKC